MRDRNENERDSLSVQAHSSSLPLTLKKRKMNEAHKSGPGMWEITHARTHKECQIESHFLVNPFHTTYPELSESLCNYVLDGAG